MAEINSSINEEHPPKLNKTPIIWQQTYVYVQYIITICILVYFILKQLINSTTLTATATIGEEAFSLNKQ